VLLIGSVARGDFGLDSDIDVAVVAKSADTGFKWDAWDIGAQVSLAHDVILNIHIYSERRWAEMRQNRSALWRNIERDGIDLAPETTSV
jgi:predicted nucleotidyltransferase